MLVMFDVITVGAAVQDVFLSGKAFKPNTEEDGDLTEEFPLGAKIEVDGVTFSTGGGASNAAVTFARHGLSTALISKLGHDPAAEAVQKAMAEEGIDMNHVAFDEKLSSDYSTILLSPGGERTILIYRGASHNMQWVDYDLSAVEAKWAYVTSLGGDFEFLNAFADWANSKGIKIAMDPGSKEIANKEAMKQLLTKLTVIKANREELGSLVGLEEPEAIIRALSETVEYAIVTDGPKGSWATDGQQIVKAGMYEDTPTPDRTGAGDAFGSGFVAKIIEEAGLTEALTFGSANSTSVVQQIGAKTGILRKDAQLHDMPLEISRF